MKKKILRLLEKRDEIYLGMTNNEELIRQITVARENAWKEIREIDKKLIVMLKKSI